MKRENKIFVISGPSGVGQDTVMRELEKFHLPLQRVITTASRPMRPGEQQGKPYHFVTENQFDEMIKNEEFVEFANVFNNRKGITKKALDQVLQSSSSALIQLEHQGAKTIKKLYPEATIFIIIPPSTDELNKRLINRGKMSKTEMTTRLKENANWQENYTGFKYMLENPTGHPEIPAAKIAKVIEKELKS